MSAFEVFIADDDPEILYLLVTVVSNISVDQREILVETEGDGRPALEKLRKKRFDVIVLDHVMPSMTGLSVIKEIRSQSGPNQDTTALLFSGNLESVDPARQVIGSEGTFVLEKPFDLENFKRIITMNLLKKAAGQESAA